MSDDPLVGQVVAERFKVTRLIGEGQMARVYVADQISMHRPVALKVLKRELSRDPSAPARFRREVEAVKRLHSPHTIQFHDFGSAGGLLFIAMELLDGETLRDRLDRDGTVSAPDTIAIVRQIANALTEAHSHGVIHRDLKPENVHLQASPGQSVPFVKVVDFGLAKLLDQSPDSLPNITAPNTTVGTPAYLAPEMMIPGHLPDTKVDLYALGVMTFEMLTGDRPFDAKNPLAMMMAHRSKPVPSAYPGRPDLPRGLDAFMTVALAKDPEERLGDADTFVRALEAALAA